MILQWIHFGDQNRLRSSERQRQLAAQLKHPLLASNCYRKDTGELEYSPFTVIERAGARVGVVGIASTIIDKTMPENFSRARASPWETRSCPATSAPFESGSKLTSLSFSHTSDFRRT